MSLRFNLPSSQITWLDGEGAVLSDGIEKSTREVENTRRVTAVSKIKFTATKEHHNTTLTCQVGYCEFLIKYKIKDWEIVQINYNNL